MVIHSHDHSEGLRFKWGFVQQPKILGKVLQNKMSIEIKITN